MPVLRRSGRSDQPYRLAPAAQALAARVRPDFRKAVYAAVLAMVAATTSSVANVHSDEPVRRLVAYGAAAVFLALAVVCVRSAAAEAQRILDNRVGGSHSSAVKILITILGAIVTISTTLGLVAVPVAQLLVSGAITGVVLGIAAQQSLGNLFAGLVLLTARPFTVGQHVELRSGGLGGPYRGRVAEVGFTYVTLETDDGTFCLPNAGVLAAATAVLATPSPSRDRAGTSRWDRDDTERGDRDDTELVTASAPGSARESR